MFSQMTKSSLATERELIKAAVTDYYEGWFEGDVARMERALHPDLVKRSAGDRLGITTKERMLELTAGGEGANDACDGRLEIEIENVFCDIASVTVRAGPYHEYLHLVRTGEGWKIANALWRLR
jgi:putative lumazine-binding protein